MKDDVENQMNGAEVLVKNAVDLGIEVCFANAGTTEMPLVAAMDRIKGIKAVLGLFEGVCTGAADGYGRMSGRPAMTLLHLGPGFANGIANLHNARRAHTPILNIIGEHATWHRPADPPLAMDIEGLTGTVSGWTRTVGATTDIPRDLAVAISAASRGQIASLIVPHDFQLASCEGGVTEILENDFDPMDEGEIRGAARILKGNGKTALLLGSRALGREGLLLAAEIRALTGCDLITETFPGMIERGAGLPDVARIPYFPEAAMEMLSGYSGVVLAGALEPVTFFGYPGIRSHILREDQIKAPIGTGNQDLLQAMRALLEELKGGGRVIDKVAADTVRLTIPDGELTPANISRTLAALQPEGAIIVDEGLTTSLDYFALTAGAPPHTILTITGGAIGYGMPCAIGAALACPDRRVINLQADGSGMYTVQSLWTQAREGLNITTMICSNRSYRILRIELVRAGVASTGANTSALIDLAGPDLDWVKIAGGFGVPAVSVTSVKELAEGLKRGRSEKGPFLIEMMVE